MLRASRRPTRCEAVDQSAQPFLFFSQIPFILHRKTFTVGEFLRIGSSFPSTFGLNILPRMRPSNICGGSLSPNANSTPAEQCATACAALILPTSARYPA